MRSFFIVIFLIGSHWLYSQANVTAMEYFIDTDPGVGSATDVSSFAGGTTFDEGFTIPSSELSEGFHTIVIRVQDENLVWSVLEARSIYVSPSDLIVTANVVAAEYYVDTDPGVGGGTPFDISGGTTLDEDFTIPTASLPEGFHTIGVRLQDSDGIWSVQESRSIYVTGDDPISTADVVAAEYYLDTDPGIGMGTEITGFTTGASVSIDFTVPNASLTEGFHILVIRFQDSDGVWSEQESRAIFVSGTDPIVVNNVVDAEYYIDNDPGIGAGVALDVTDASTFDIDFTILSADLPEGFHTLVIRAQDENGLWGMQESRAVYVSNTNPLGTTEVTDIEVFVDADPGVGNAESIDIVDVVNFDETTSIRSDTLSPGMHTVSFRALDAMGVWSAVESRSFFVDPFLTVPLDQAGGALGTIGSKIGSYEYFIDDDPGFGLGEVVAVDPTLDSIDIDFVIPGDTLTGGTHLLGIRVLNEAGLPSLTEYIEFSMCNGADVQFSATIACLGDTTVFTDLSTGVIAGDNYSWDFDGDMAEDSVSVGDGSFIYNTAGTYSASLTISNDDCTATGTLEVTVADLPVVTSLASADSVCLGDEVTLTGSGASSYDWDNGVTDGVAFAPTESASYLVMGTDANGCVNVDSVEVVVNSLPEVVANSSESSICFGGEVVLTGTGADTYSWNNGVDDGVAFSPPLTRLYTLTGTGSNGCMNTDVIEVIVHALPNVRANSSEDAVCDGEELVLTGTGASTYVWDQGVIDGESFIPADTLTYTVTGTDNNGCVNSESIEIPVVVVERPEIIFGNDDGRMITLESSVAMGNQWYEDGDLMVGETDQTITVQRTYIFGGKYQVAVTEHNCTSPLSEEYDVMILGMEDISNQVTVWPNPATHQLKISGVRHFGEFTYELIDLSGSIVYSGHVQTHENTLTIPLENISSGVYLLKIDGMAGHFKFAKK